MRRQAKQIREPVQWVRINNVPIPPRKKPPTRVAEYPFDLIEVGEPVQLNRSCAATQAALRYYLKKRKGTGRFQVRPVSDKVCRIWRTA